MAGFRRSSGSNVALTTRKRRASGAWVDIVTAKRRSGGAWVDLFTFVAISNQSPTASNVGLGGPRSATASYTLNSAGGAVVNSTPVSGEWLASGAASGYDVRATLASGTSPSGSAVGSWLNLGTTRAWSLTASAGFAGASQVLLCTLTVEIRDASTLAVLDTATISISATAEWAV